VGWDLPIPSFVVDSPLLASVDPADRQHVWLVEVSDGLKVLSLAVFNDQPMLRIKGIHGQLRPSALLSWVAEQPREPVLAA